VTKWLKSLEKCVSIEKISAHAAKYEKNHSRGCQITQVSATTKFSGTVEG